jgi:hypothetical protein
VTVKKLPQQEGEGLADYVKRMAVHFGNNPTPEEIESKIQECREKQWQMMCHEIVREQFGHVFEAFLLIERLTYFARIIQGKPEKYLIAMFDVFSHLSPRGFAISTIRID